MKLPGAPRQPFVGLALMAVVGIIGAEVFPVSSVILIWTATILALCILIFAWWPKLAATYAIVGIAFFLVHKFQTTDTAGQQLANQLGNRPRVVTITGAVITEPKTAPSGFATFLLKLKST